VWTRQNGLCMYCDIITAPPDVEGIATCCCEYMTTTVKLSDRAKLLKAKQDANTELGQLLCDRILNRVQDVFVCVACAQAYTQVCGGKRVGFSHVALLELPAVANDALIFAYFTACSELHLVFSIFLSEADVANNNTDGNFTDEDDNVELDNTMTTSVTIMAYVTNIRELELVYVKMPITRLGLAARWRFRDGFILRNPRFQATAVQRLRETSVDLSVDSMTSRWHIFDAIYTRVWQRVVSFMQESDTSSAFAGRLFLYLCQCLFESNINTRYRDSAPQIWQFICDQTQHMYATRTEFG